MHTLCSIESYKPLKLLLEHTLTITTVCPKDSIQARLGGDSLMPTIKQADEVITNLGNLVTVKEYTRDGIALLKLYPSVGRLPIATVSDGGVHLGFDLTQNVLRLVDLLSMAPLEVLWGDQWTVQKLAQHIQHMFLEGGEWLKPVENYFSTGY
jgi:hypothetical protein